jgi:hypothetical protein
LGNRRCRQEGRGLLQCKSRQKARDVNVLIGTQGEAWVLSFTSIFRSRCTYSALRRTRHSALINATPYSPCPDPLPQRPHCCLQTQLADR